MANQKLCFVIGPIGKAGTEVRRHADWLLKGIIKPVFKQHFTDYDVVRADEIVQPGNISSQVINRLFDAPLVIADMSLGNANAFYELAIRHMKRLRTIHMINAGEDIPFDVFPYRAIYFSYTDPTELESAQADLKSAVEETIKADFVIENPITHARGVIELEEHASEAQKVILDELQMLRQRIAAIESMQTSSSNVPLFPSERDVIAQVLRQGGKAKTRGILSDFFASHPPSSEADAELVGRTLAALSNAPPLTTPSDSAPEQRANPKKIE